MKPVITLRSPSGATDIVVLTVALLYDFQRFWGQQKGYVIKQHRL